MTKARNLADNALTTVSPTELGYLDGVTSAVQTQIDAKLATATASTTYLANSLVDAKGDVLTATADNTPARLAVGTDGQVLTAASGQSTGLQWATPSSGSYTSIASGTLSTAEVTLGSIVGTYRNLVLVITNPYFNTGAGLGLRINGSTSASAYQGTIQITSSVTQKTTGADSQWGISNGAALITSAPTADQWVCIFEEYAVNGGNKRMRLSAFHGNGEGGFSGIYHCSSVTAPITSVSIRSTNGSSTFSGGTYTLYGVK
jgi:hypothetical protein